MSTPNQTNQHKPCPPEDELRPFLTYYYGLGFNDKKVASECLLHFDAEQYGLSASTVKRLRRKWDLKSTRQQKHTFESIAGAVAEIRKRFPTRGSENIRKNLLQEYGMRVSRKLISNFLTITEPDAVAARRQHRFRRKRFWSAGVNDVWCQDQHDKWKRFGLFFHNNIDPFMSYNNWLKVWWTNRNPRLIVKFYIEAARKLGGVPLITQSDRGTENNGVANAHTVIRHRLDPTLRDTLQHKWMSKNKNIKSEGNWSVLRRDFTPGLEQILDDGVNNGWYDADDPLESLVFRWVMIPWIQAEMDRWVIQRNQTAPRRDKNKILPHGIPELIRLHPERFGSADFKVTVPPSLFDEVEALYAPPDHPVFDLVPPPFEERARTLYGEMGCPPVTSDTVWTVYLQLLGRFRALGNDPVLIPILESHRQMTQIIDDEDMPLLPGLRPLRNGDNVIGMYQDEHVGGDSVASVINSDHPRLPLHPEYAIFTDDEDSEDNSQSD